VGRIVLRNAWISWLAISLVCLHRQPPDLWRGPRVIRPLFLLARHHRGHRSRVERLVFAMAVVAANGGPRSSAVLSSAIAGEQPESIGVIDAEENDHGP
jgi:hypothetical protein